MPTLIYALVGLGMGEPLAGSLFGASSLCFLVAGAGLHPRTLVILGVAALLAALVLIATTDEAPLSVVLIAGVPALCIARMAYLREGSAARTTRP